MRARSMIVMGLLFGLGGCGGGEGGSGGSGLGGADTTTSTGGAGGATGGMGGATGGAGGAGGATGGTGGTGGAAAVLAPTMKSVEKMQGALHVAWKNNTPDCEKIELDRKHDAGDYAVAYTLTGVATSKHDTQAVPPGSYCYKARCIKGAETSPDSNEMCGTP